MQTVTLAEAQAHLPELLQVLEPGEELTIVAGGQTLAQVKKMLPETAEDIGLERIAVKSRRTFEVDEPAPNSGWIDEEFMESCVEDSNPDISLAVVRARLSAIEGSLDELVSALYGLTPEEIKLVEEGTS